MGNDHRAPGAEVLVTAGVVRMPVGIQHELHRLIGDLSDHLPNRVRQGSVLVVHQENAVFANGEAHIAADAAQEEYAGRNLVRSDRDFLFASLRGCRDLIAAHGLFAGGPQRSWRDQQTGKADKDAHNGLLFCISSVLWVRSDWPHGFSALRGRRKSCRSWRYRDPAPDTGPQPPPGRY